MIYTHTALIGALTTMHAVSNEDPAPPELFTILGALGQLNRTAKYVIYDMEQSGGTLVPSEELVDQLVPSTPEQQGAELANWDGSAPGSFGYGDLHLLHAPAGLGLTFTVGGSAAQSAMTVWVVPVTAEHPPVNVTYDHEGAQQVEVLPLG
jgi:hypothetical protein